MYALLINSKFFPLPKFSKQLLALIANVMSISLPGMPAPSTPCNQLLQVYGQVMALQATSNITQTAQSLVHKKPFIYVAYFYYL